MLLSVSGLHSLFSMSFLQVVFKFLYTFHCLQEHTCRISVRSQHNVPSSPKEAQPPLEEKEDKTRWKCLDPGQVLLSRNQELNQPAIPVVAGGAKTVEGEQAPYLDMVPASRKSVQAERSKSDILSLQMYLIYYFFVFNFTWFSNFIYMQVSLSALVSRNTSFYYPITHTN